LVEVCAAEGIATKMQEIVRVASARPSPRIL
jgi:hypothetical protein